MLVLGRKVLRTTYTLTKITSVFIQYVQAMQDTGNKKANITYEAWFINKLQGNIEACIFVVWKGLLLNLVSYTYAYISFHQVHDSAVNAIISSKHALMPPQVILYITIACTTSKWATTT